MRRLHPELFDKKHPNPWDDFTLKSRTRSKKHAVIRDEVNAFAYGRIEHGEVEVAAVAVICFEWLQRPENVVARHIKWTGYRNGKPTIRIEHHKTGAVVDHPLEEDGVKFYEEAEDVLRYLPKLGIPLVLHQRRSKVATLFVQSTVQHIVQKMRKELKLPAHFTLDACRHRGMTELEEAELTEGQGRALSAHKTSQAYSGYAKRTEKRMLSATRKRFAHRLVEAAVNEPETKVRNEASELVRNDHPEQKKIGE